VTKKITLIILSNIVFLFLSVNASADDCVINFESKICLVEKEKVEVKSIPEAVKHQYNRKCETLKAEFKNDILTVVNKMPEDLKPIFCHIKKFFIEKEFYATGYAGPHFSRSPEDDSIDLGKAYKEDGWIIGLSLEKIFHTDTNLSEWFTKKEMTLFGFEMTDEVPKEFPKFSFEFGNGIFSERQMLIYEVVLHEIGHLVDMANSVSMDILMPDCNYADFSCGYYNISPWSLMTRNPDLTWREGAGYYRDVPCYYGCKNAEEGWEPFDKSEIRQFYTSFYEKSGFVTPYASVNSMEDFAESFTFHFYKELDPLMQIEITPGKLNDLYSEKWLKNHFLIAKDRFIDNLFDQRIIYGFESNEVIYPDVQEDSISSPIYFVD